MARDRAKRAVLERANASENPLQILLLFCPHNKEMTATEVSRKLNLHKATASRSLLTLVSRDFLQQDPRSRAFRLGASVLRLATAIKRSLKTNLVQIAKPFVDELRDPVHDTVGLEVISAESTVLAYLAEGTLNEDGPRPAERSRTRPRLREGHDLREVVRFASPERLRADGP